MKALKLTLGTREFSPGVASSLLTLLLLPLFVQLGFWQLFRMQQKIDIQQELTLRMAETPLKFDQRLKDLREDTLQTIKYRRLSVIGQFLNQHSILLDNQTLNGKVGYLVITPFKPADTSDIIILVNRGFIPAGPTRLIPPPIKEANELNLLGTLTPAKHGVLSKQAPLEQPTVWPIQIQKIEYAELSKLFNKNVLPFILELQKNHPDNFQVVPLNFNLQANRHLGYAVQWFTIAFVALIYYLVINTRRR